MKLENLKSPKGATHSRKRVGRGSSSGYGKTSGRGENGQKSRAGAKRKQWFEGGQMPLQRRIPKKGFKSPHKEIFHLVNVKNLNVFDDEAVITPELLREKGLVNGRGPVKLLGDGTLKKKLSIKLEAVSKAAAEKVKAAGGIVEEI
ncbi:50S ribosomal protein L15 [bacterium]|nr:50S ribosomal protein L15 [bacterium]